LAAFLPLKNPASIQGNELERTGFYLRLGSKPLDLAAEAWLSQILSHYGFAAQSEPANAQMLWIREEFWQEIQDQSDTSQACVYLFASTYFTEKVCPQTAQQIFAKAIELHEDNLGIWNFPQSGWTQLQSNTWKCSSDLPGLWAMAVFGVAELNPIWKDAVISAQGKVLLPQMWSGPDPRSPWVDLGLKTLVQKTWKPNSNQKLRPLWQDPDQHPIAFLTHDIDNLLRWNVKRILWLVASSLWMWTQPKTWLSEIKSCWKSVIFAQDPLDQIATVLKIDAHRPATFFALGWYRDHLVKRYDLTQKRFRKILEQIPQKGAKLGLHGSPVHYCSQEGLSQERLRLDGIPNADSTLHRMHFLFWDPIKTPQALDAAGIRMDSSLGWNDMPGLRRGTAFPYRLWDFEQHKLYDFIEIPLVWADHQVQELLNTRHPQSKLQGQDATETLHRAWIQSALESIALCSQGGGICTILLHDLYFSPIILSDHPQAVQAFFDQADAAHVKWVDPIGILLNPTPNTHATRTPAR
jgi:hypothetical protein